MQANRPFFPVRRLAGALATAALLALPAAALAAEAAQSLKLQVNGMVCSFCAQGIEKRLKALPAERVASEVREAGYEVVATETVAQTVAQIRAETRAARQGR